ncbi:MAG: nucleotide sugar dehydrogenase [Dehalococcoidales bacterium]|nr:nucleotide sugar dehydrogenase [Dehalococcoidales bacterium]MDP6576802.1 nucleotide sugar dehydrogenase [Dehalococcoidales bacterium]MDP6824599.1 nucleotide sugar dehydrogenase [Dehalococcoidales bacterium]
MDGISIIGIGKLGLCVAACLAASGYRVIGVDKDPVTIKAVNQGQSPIYEPGLAELMQGLSAHLSATDDYKYAIENSDITFMVVPTPSEKGGGFSTRYVEAASREIAANLKNKPGFHLVVLTSTVLPGDTDNVIKYLLEEVSGKKCGVDFGLCYSPEFIALGSVIRDFTNPDVVLIGESDPRSGDLLSKIYMMVCENHPPVVRGTIYNAEVAKIALNSYVTMKISFANTLAEICERIPGGDVDMVSRALGFDSRIGRKYLSGGTSYGGPCFPRDNKAFSSFIKRIGGNARLAETTDQVNNEQISRVIDLIKQQLGDINGKKVAILGLTYKTNTDVIEESASMAMARALGREGAAVAVCDPAGMENARKVLGKSVEYAGSAGRCLEGAEFAILAMPWDEFKNLRPEDFTGAMKTPKLLDCWRVYDRLEFGKKLEYFAIGLSPT